MTIPVTDELPISLRAYAVRADNPSGPSRSHKGSEIEASEWHLIFDCETRVDPAQSLRLGAYQIRQCDTSRACANQTLRRRESSRMPNADRICRSNPFYDWIRLSRDDCRLQFTFRYLANSDQIQLSSRQDEGRLLFHAKRG